MTEETGKTVVVAENVDERRAEMKKELEKTEKTEKTEVTEVETEKAKTTEKTEMTEMEKFGQRGGMEEEAEEG